ncbi:unnamed protein product [Oppiella nova]|uniref:Uncharacterized protein n=1 Tax=Oppiella nova TaxID=334625 RepID=A0A7R9LL27_9ACAR|nr:unnamed protein product [Oppiella nova]CAG2164655.1 unnamed protein product [Oppiella nova]
MNSQLILVSIVLFIAGASCDKYDYPISDYLAVRDSRNFTGKVVLVTGSSAGIGAGVAKLFSLLGANVVVTGRNQSRIDSVAQEAQELSPNKLKPLKVTADLRVSADVKRLYDTTMKTFGRLDVLINNAGIYPMSNISTDNLINQWNDIFNTNVIPMVELVRLAVPALQKSQGSIIDMSSILGIAPAATQLAYSTSKATVLHLTRILALELGPLGIRVNTINPGAIAVERTVVISGKAFDELIPRTPLRRNGHALDIAKGAVFLASSDAQFITGANLVIDGGLVYNYPTYIQ